MKNKGFTLVELLAAMVILAILIMIGVMTVSNVFDNTKDNYYKSMENTLNIAGNEFFNDNRQEKPIDDYNFVDLATLQEHEYLEELMTYDNKEKCDPKSGVFIFNDNDHTGYEVCLICGDHKSKGDFCNGKKMGVIDVSGNVNEPNGPFYNPLLSYSGTSWINALSIYIHFNLETEGMSVSEYKIYNANTNGYVGSCTGMSGNSCTKSFSTTGSYYVEAYGTQAGVEGSGKIANRKYFNVKIDNTPPTFSLKDTDPIIELEKDNIVEPYENEVIDINDDNGYKEVKYSIEQYKGKNADGTEKYDPVSGHTDVDIKDKDLKIPASLESGKYKLRVTVTDFAGNKGKCNNCTNKETNEIIFYIKYKIDLQYYDKSDKKHDVGNLWIYTYGLYREEDASGTATKNLPTKIRVNSNPQDVDWYMNANLVGSTVTSYEPQVQKTGYHILYAREQKMKTGFNASCNKGSGGKLVYDSTYQTLVNIPQDEEGKYRLVVYYDNQLISNQGRDARTYTVIAVLNSEYMWNDVPVSDAKKARAIKCSIYPKKVDKPVCDDKIYNGGLQKLVSDSSVDNSGVNTDSVIKETTYQLDKVPYGGPNVGTYSFTATLNSNHNFSWDGTYSFPTNTITCNINPKKITINYQCADLTYNGTIQTLLKDFNETVYGDTTAGYNENEAVLVVNPDIEYDYNKQFGPSNPYADYDLGYGEYGTSAGAGGYETLGIDLYDKPTGEPMYTIAPISAYNARTYDIIFKLQSNNYVFDDGSKIFTKSCTIKQMPVSVEWEGPDSFEYDGENHLPEAKKFVVGGTHDQDITFVVEKEVSDLGDKYKATASCAESGDKRVLSNSPEIDYCSNFSFSNTTYDFKIVDTTAPTCSISVASDGKLSATLNDNHSIWEYHLTKPSGDSTQSTMVDYSCKTKSTTAGYTATTTGTYKIGMHDCTQNEGSCSVTVKKQISTATCKTGNRCSSAGCETREQCYYCSSGSKKKVDDEWKCCSTDDDGNETCSSMSYGRDSSCDCETYNRNISKCGCEEWNGWSDWTDDNNCSDGEASDHSSKTKCQYAKG